MVHGELASVGSQANFSFALLFILSVVMRCSVS